MAEMNLAAVMEALAARVGAIPGTAPDTLMLPNVSGWPNPTITPPAFVVDYPPQIDMDATYGRGSDRAQFPCWAVFGAADSQSARDVLSSFLLAIKAALDGEATAEDVVIWQSARAMNIKVIKVLDEDGVEMLAAEFTVDVLT